MEINRKNAQMWARLGPRATYGLALFDLIERNKRVYAMSADLGASSGLARLMKVYPERYLNTGIAEQNLIGIAAGFAKENLIPFASSFAPFITHRCADQIRMNMGYMHLNIKTVGLGSGISMGLLGNSHYGLDDLSFMRSVPTMTILSPCDCVELVLCINAAAEYEGPVYIRLTGEPGMPKVYEDDFGFEIGKSHVLREGIDLLMLATGSMVSVALKAAEILADCGMSATVVDVHTIKPFDTDVFDLLTDKSKAIVTLEEHSVVSGLGAEVDRYVASNSGMPKTLNIGLPDEYIHAGTYDYMLKRYGLTAEAVATRIKKEV